MLTGQGNREVGRQGKMSAGGEFWGAGGSWIMGPGVFCAGGRILSLAEQGVLGCTASVHIREEQEGS